MKRNFLQIAGELSNPFDFLPSEVIQTIAVYAHHQVSQLSTVCQEWYTLLSTYTGWFKVVVQNYGPLMDQYNLHTLGLSQSVIGKANDILLLLHSSPHFQKENAYTNYVCFLLNAKLTRLSPEDKNRPLILLRALHDHVIENHKNVLAQRNFHPRDFRLTFQEEGHRYALVVRDEKSSTFRLEHTIKPDDNEDLVVMKEKDDDLNSLLEYTHSTWFLKSVTTFIHTLFPEFIEDQVIDKMMANTKKWEDPEQNKYFGMTKEGIKVEWERIRTEASCLGTAMHLNLERYYNNLKHETETLEFKLFEQFEAEQIRGKLRAYRTEWTIHSELLQICGSVDILYEYIDEKESLDGKKHLVLMDWKRSKAINMFNVYEGGSIPATEHAGNCNYVHYGIQLSLYKWILEQHYNVVIDAMYLVVLHPNQKRYIQEEIKPSEIGPLMTNLINYRLTQVNQPPVLLKKNTKFYWLLGEPHETIT